MKGDEYSSTSSHLFFVNSHFSFHLFPLFPLFFSFSPLPSYLLSLLFSSISVCSLYFPRLLSLLLPPLLLCSRALLLFRSISFFVSFFPPSLHPVYPFTHPLSLLFHSSNKKRHNLARPEFYSSTSARLELCSTQILLESSST